MKPSEAISQSAAIDTEVEAIYGVFDRLAAAWNAGDAKAFVSCLTEDCDYVTFAGQHLKGRQPNEQVHHDLFNSWALKGSTLHSGVELPTIAFLSSTIALMHSTGTVQLRFQKDPPLNRLSIQTTVLIKENNTWKIRAFHNCRIQKPGLFQRLFMALKSN